MRIAQGVRVVGLAPVMVRFDVARAACQHDSIDLIDQFVESKVIGENRDDQRDRIGGLGNGFQVFFPRHVERVGLENTAVSRNSNNRFSAHMGTNPALLCDPEPEGYATRRSRV